MADEPGAVVQERPVDARLLGVGRRQGGPGGRRHQGRRLRRLRQRASRHPGEGN